MLGMGTSAVAEKSLEALPTLEQINEGSGIITQLVILVVTLIGLFKKKKNVEPKTKVNE